MTTSLLTIFLRLLSWGIPVMVLLAPMSDACYGRAILEYANALDPKLQRSLNSTARKTSPLRYYHYTFQHLPKEDPSPKLLRLYPNLKISFTPENRLISVLCRKNEWKTVNKILRNWDQTLQQIQLDVKVVEISYTNSSDYTPIISSLRKGVVIPYSFEDGHLQLPKTIPINMQALLQQGKASILANPSLNTLNGYAVKFRVGDNIPYLTTVIDDKVRFNQIHQVSTGIQIELKPKITSENHLFIDINAKISSVKVWKELGDSRYPVLANRDLSTQIRVKNQDTFLIAGLFQSNSKENTSGVPILSSIPILGALFKGRSKESVKTDVLISIKPHIK